MLQGSNQGCEDQWYGRIFIRLGPARVHLQHVHRAQTMKQRSLAQEEERRAQKLRARILLLKLCRNELPCQQLCMFFWEDLLIWKTMFPEAQIQKKIAIGANIYKHVLSEKH